MALFRCRKFLFCLSLRSGVMVLALLAMLISGLGVGGAGVELSWVITQHQVSLARKIAIFSQGAVLTLLFLLSLLGLIAGVHAGRGVVYIYSKMTFIHGPFLLAALGLTLFTTFKERSTNTIPCLNGSSSAIIKQFCDQEQLSLVLILPIALLGAACLIQFYSWVVAISYGEAFGESDMSSVVMKYASSSGSDLESMKNPSTAPENPFQRLR
ncbi:unnamed protein product [Mycena citricolor]|uniref:Uncharacterized protein n=1 Tax=Mycena citricolor TaxID=2018698 RepID=A0AAD2K3S7_9AGAR|nr:unnamed protein product [Mycena citricolor]